LSQETGRHFSVGEDCSHKLSLPSEYKFEISCCDNFHHVFDDKLHINLPFGCNLYVDEIVIYKELFLNHSHEMKVNWVPVVGGDNIGLHTCISS
jgi:hypothetical protein